MTKLKQLLNEVTRLMYPWKVYAVGGCVRDYILKIEPNDYDFCTNALPDDIEKLVKKDKRRAYCVGKRFGTIGCKIDGEMIEITTFRTESYEEGNRKPTVEFVDDINLDLSRRDFTINAMAVKLNKRGYIQVIDPFQGRKDLKAGLIKCVGIPKHRIKEDPLRILRAIRFACRFMYDIDDLTYRKMKSGSIQLLNVSKERWVSELDKILMSPFLGVGLYYLWDANCFKWMIPELHLQLNFNQLSTYHRFSLSTHTALVSCACPKDINMKWAALLHDVAKPFVQEKKLRKPLIDWQLCGVIPNDNDKFKANYVGHEVLGADMVEQICRKLKFSNERRKFVVDTIKNHLNEDGWLKEFDDGSKKGEIKQTSMNILGVM